MISEPKMIHKLWNILEEKGYKVSGEVKVVQNEKYREIWNSKSTLEKNQPYVNTTGSIKFKKKGRVSTTIDLVATDGERFMGFEVKDTFEAVVRCIARGQLEDYIKGAMLDEIYLVIPAHECEHVKSSYRRSYLEKKGVGLVTLDENYNLSKVSPSSTFQRSAQPHLKENEA